jgi:uncharacterized protein (DUF427 family)
MSLTMGRGPLAHHRPGEVNYDLDGPKHLLFLHDFPRRVRAFVGDRAVLDSRRGRLLHESGMLPVLYVPEDDLDLEVLHASDTSTHCPFKGDASYWHVRVGDREVPDAVWAYPDPLPAARWLAGLRSLTWGAAERWYDEAEEVHGHLRDPYHRVDVRAASDRVRVRAGDTVLAESGAAKVLSETGLPNRFYLPRADVHADLARSDTTAVCPYKGTSSYWSVPVGGSTLADAAWSYQDPLPDATELRDHVSFLHDDLTVEALPR